MAVKVVQGLIGEYKPAPQVKPNTQTQNNLNSVQSSVAASRSAIQYASTEAVSVTIRSTKSSGSAEKIRDPKEAREAADQVADKIRESNDSLDVHDKLSAANGGQHLEQ